MTVLHAKQMPKMGLGTYGRRGAEGQKALEAGLQIGYRLLDTAQDYDTETEVGAAISASGLKRDEIFVTTKIATSNLGESLVIPSVEQSLKNLGLTQVDLVLIHWPAPNGAIEPAIYLQQLAAVQKLGLAKSVGVSNFTIALIEQARDVLGEVPILTNQVEVHPYLQNKNLVAHCLSRGISITCYQPLAHGAVIDDPVLVGIGAEIGAGADQVALAYLMQQGLAVIPSSASFERMARNFSAQKVKLSDAHMAKIAELERGERRIAPEWGPAWDL